MFTMQLLFLSVGYPVIFEVGQFTRKLYFAARFLKRLKKFFFILERISLLLILYSFFNFFLFIILTIDLLLF